MDLQKKPSPPPIPNSPAQSGARTPINPQAPISAQAQSYTTFATVGSLLIAIFVMINFGSNFITILRYLGDIGGAFFFKYLLGSNSTILLILVAAAGGFALLSKNKWGWPLAYGAALFNIFISIFTFIVVIDSPVAWTIYTSIIHTLLFYFAFFLSIGVVVLLSMQPVKTRFQVDSTQQLIGFGILAFLALDTLFCFFVL